MHHPVLCSPHYLALIVYSGLIIIIIVIAKLDGFPMALIFPTALMFPITFIEEDLIIVAVVAIPDHPALVVDPGIIIIIVVIGKLDGFPMALMFPMTIMFPIALMFPIAFIEEDLIVVAVVAIPDDPILFVDPGIIIIMFVIGKLDGFSMAFMFPLALMFPITL